MNRRTGMLTVLLAVLLGATTIWSYGRMSSSKRAAIGAYDDLTACRAMAARIERCRNRPAVASQQQRLSSEVTGMVESAAKSAAISPEKLVRISPSSPQRLGDSVYKEAPTQVELKNVPLKQLVEMVYHLTGDKDQGKSKKGLCDKSIRLTAPRREDIGDLWSAELVLTYLIYDPPSAGQ